MSGRPFWGEQEGGDHPRMEVTEAMVGVAIKVQNALGPGLLEEPFLHFHAWPLKEGLKRVVNTKT